MTLQRFYLQSPVQLCKGKSHILFIRIYTHTYLAYHTFTYTPTQYEMDRAVYTQKFAVIYSFQCTRKKKNHVYTVDPGTPFCLPNMIMHIILIHVRNPSILYAKEHLYVYTLHRKKNSSTQCLVHSILKLCTTHYLISCIYQLKCKTCSKKKKKCKE